EGQLGARAALSALRPEPKGLLTCSPYGQWIRVHRRDSGPAQVPGRIPCCGHRGTFPNLGPCLYGCQTRGQCALSAEAELQGYPVKAMSGVATKAATKAAVSTSHTRGRCQIAA